MKAAFFVLGCAVLLSVSITYAQPDTVWTRTYGSSGFENASSISKAANGDFIVVGFASSGSILQAYTLRINIQGDTVWTRRFPNSVSTWGISGGELDIETIPILAISNSEPGSVNYTSWLFWAAHPDGAAPSSFPGLYSAAMKFRNHQIAMTGTLFNSPAPGRGFLQILSGSMIIIQRSYPLGYSTFFDDMALVGSGYIMAGGTFAMNPDASNFLFVRADSLGDTLWTRIYGGLGNDDVTSLTPTGDGGFAFIGTSDSYCPLGDIFIMKLNAAGDSLWSRIHSGWENSEATKIIETADGGLLIIGSAFANGNDDVLLLKLDADGFEEWRQTYGGVGGDYARDVVQLADGGYLVAATTESFGAGLTDIWLIRLAAPNAVNSHSENPRNFALEQNYPNPFNAGTRISFSLSKSSTVSLRIFDTLGREVTSLLRQVKLNAGHHEVNFEAGELPSGLYFYRLETEQGSETRKLLFLK